MANNLNIDLTGKVVVIDAKTLKPEFAPEERRLFLVEGGFGASPDTMGGAIFGTWLEDGLRDRLDGRQVEKLAADQDPRPYAQRPDTGTKTKED